MLHQLGIPPHKLPSDFHFEEKKRYLFFFFFDNDLINEQTHKRVSLEYL
jgi:hypothetical protein